MMEPQVVTYKGFLPNGRADGQVAYLVHENCVYFTGLTRQATSTINAAEAVVEAVCKKEGLDWKEVSFVDILTYRVYRPSAYRSSQQHIYKVMEVSLEQAPHYKALVSARGWKDIEKEDLPKEVVKALEVFME